MNHAALVAEGPFAQRIAELFWLFVIVAAVVYGVVIGFLIYSLARRQRAAAAANAMIDPPRAVRTIAFAVGVTGVILIGLALADFFANRALARVPDDALRVRVTAHQWWWDVEYLDPNASQRVRTANELTIPVGRAVVLELQSGDVIHSFWVPSLQGKKDLLPGYTNHLALLAARAGDYTGECAEFCGFQHAHMSIDVSAQPADEFERWRVAQLAPAAEPQDALGKHGYDVFHASSCGLCHAVQGTDAGATLGPDLTHVASRRRLAAGALPNNPAALAAWISDPQSIKPGTKMPATRLAAADLTALASYLASLR
jgi:cytochrome c oxidase subunit 2